MPVVQFKLGRVVATPGALEALERLGEQPLTLLIRYSLNDWGDLDAEDKAANNLAAKSGERILSAYKLGDVKIWVITEWDRSYTTILRPCEY